MNSAYLSPGERHDILFDFFPNTIGNSISLQSQSFSGIGSQGTQMDLLRFDNIGNLSSGGIVPQNLPPINYYDIIDINGTRDFTLTQEMMEIGMHRINGLTYKMNRIDETIPYNQLEEWKFINSTNNFHPMHVHGVLLQVHSRNGNPNIPPNDKGWKDTVLVNPNETVQMLVKFNDDSGIYLLHCHYLEHEDDGMMLNILIDASTNVENENSPPDTFELNQNYPNPLNQSTVISWKQPVSGFVSLKIFNTEGKEIVELVKANMKAGTHSINFDALNLSSGMYIYKLQNSNFVETKKMIL
ncbi:MAG: hypothetical protein CVV23_05310 [Ignavibacteriae bacterium HGW-Ignavibacteriae-2]|jgi:hypothetical protein|nr:MAG: hypothetical protein CVV23_05310 [Ignavibacteriae bacterium HGW-Ignavibacteriae-2]